MWVYDPEVEVVRPHSQNPQHGLWIISYALLQEEPAVAMGRRVQGQSHLSKNVVVSPDDREETLSLR